MPFSLKFRILYQEHMKFEEVARQDRPSGNSPDTEPNLEKFERGISQEAGCSLRWNLGYCIRSIWDLKRWQDKTARRAVILIQMVHRSSRKIQSEYLEKQNAVFAEVSNIASEAYENWRGGTTGRPSRSCADTEANLEKFKWEYLEN